MELILALLMMISISVAFSFYVAHRAIKQNVQPLIIKYTTPNQFPYDWDTEERFESIVRDLNK